LSKFRFNENYFDVISVMLIFVFALLVVFLSAEIGINIITSLIIAGTIVISISLIMIFVRRKNMMNAISDIIQEQDYMCTYDVKPNVIRDFNKYVYNLKKEKRNLNLFLCFSGVVIIAFALVFSGINILLTAEVSVLLILFILLIFNQIKKRMALSTLDNIKVYLSTDNVVIDGELAVWNSDMDKINDVIFRKINESTYYITVYYYHYTVKFFKYDLRYYFNNDIPDNEGFVIEEKEISIPVPASEKEKVQAVVDEMLKLKIKRR